jgi:8-oxo-dGTP pyrophosphatase MutT (NUDIX family)
MKKWEVLASSAAIETPWFHLRRDTCRLPDGQSIGDFYIVEENDVGIVFALTPDRHLVMVEQYRHGIGDMCIQLPGGLFERRNGDGKQEARREFVEETGYDAANYRFVGKLALNPMRMSSYYHLFLATEAYHVQEQTLDADEDIRIRLIPMDEVFEMILSGAIHAAGTVAGIYMAWHTLQNHP